MIYSRFKRTGKRKEIFIATKFGIDVSVGIPPGIRGDREYVKQQINKSLERLGVDSIDLVYCHRCVHVAVLLQIST